MVLELTMEVCNLSTEPIGKLHSWLPHELEPEKVVFLPDACPGKAPLPTGGGTDGWVGRNAILAVVSSVGCEAEFAGATVDERP
jgi:hypothetical protein